LLDLDAEPAVIDAHLAENGLADQVRRRPGLRMPGAFDGFEVAARELLGPEWLAVVTRAIGDPVETGIPALDRLALTAGRITAAGSVSLRGLGVPARRAEAVVSVASEIVRGRLRLEPSAEVRGTLRALTRLPGVGARSAAAIVVRALAWPDAFPAADAPLQRAAGAADARALIRAAERWQPWRGYAAAHLMLAVARA
jgi:AraC family transcriptional regulator, regulatory protein of adaptative response / DNA-3-methyladenine glycosylase II